YWKWILIRRDNHAAGRIVKRWKPIKWNEPIPFVVAGAAVRWNIAVVIPPDRQKPRRVIPDVAVHIRVDEVLSRAGESLQRRRELRPIARAVDAEKRKLKRAWLGRGPAHRKEFPVLCHNHRTMPRHPVDELHGPLALHADPVAFQPRLLWLSAKEVLAGSRIELFAIEVLDVEAEIRRTPSNPLVVANDHARHARQGDAADIEPWRFQMHHVPSRRRREIE